MLDAYHEQVNGSQRNGTPRLRAKVAVNDGDGTARVVNVEERRWSWPIKLICKEDKPIYQHR